MTELLFTHFLEIGFFQKIVKAFHEGRIIGIFHRISERNIGIGVKGAVGFFQFLQIVMKIIMKGCREQVDELAKAGLNLRR